MKRVLLAIVGTIAGTTALLSFKTSAPQASNGPLPSAGLPADSTGPAPAASVPSTNRSSTPATPGGASSKSYLGQSVTTRYGIVQVDITVQAGKITKAMFVKLTAFDGRSEQINSFAAPQLLKETLDAQSAQIDSVSGASYTSAGYEQSLQSALDSAGIR